MLVPYSSQQCDHEPLKIMPSAVLRIVSDAIVSSLGSTVPFSSYVRVLTPESTDSRLTR